MRGNTPLLPGLSPVSGKCAEACFDGGSLSSDAGVLALREIDGRLKVAERLAGCIADTRQPERVRHSLADIIRFRLLMIACGYEDGIDADSLRSDPAFKMALGRLPSAVDLCSQSTISRLENRPDARALLRMGQAMVDLYCASFRQVPQRIVLDIDDTFDAAMGGGFDLSADVTGDVPGQADFLWAVHRPGQLRFLERSQGQKQFFHEVTLKRSREPVTPQATIRAKMGWPCSVFSLLASGVLPSCWPRRRWFQPRPLRWPSRDR